jgi:hypothetical protein
MPAALPLRQRQQRRAGFVIVADLSNPEFSLDIATRQALNRATG